MYVWIDVVVVGDEKVMTDIEASSLVDVELDEPSSLIVPADGCSIAYSIPSTRGKPSYQFSIKRPRRSVVKRSIATLQTTEDEKNQTTRFVGNSYHYHRAPRLAVALLVFVCSAGGIRSVNDLWISPQITSSTMRVMDKIQQRNATKVNSASIPTVHFGQNIAVPEQLSNLVNILDEPFIPHQNKLFLWHIPRSGATSITRIASYCFGLTLASEIGRGEARNGTNELRIIEDDLAGISFANVDTSHPLGIEQAKALQVGQSDQIDFISSPYMWNLADIFDETHKGYMIAMFRHPIDRAASLYYSMMKSSEHARQVGSYTSIEQYAKSSLVENNWMTRFLSNTLSGELTTEHEAIAKEVLRSKCLVGLLHNKAETMRRLTIIFNTKSDVTYSYRRSEECEEKILYWDWPAINRHDPVIEGSDAWNLLHKQNIFDLRLYNYAQKMFEVQGALFPASF